MGVLDIAQILRPNLPPRDPRQISTDPRQIRPTTPSYEQLTNPQFGKSYAELTNVGVEEDFDPYTKTPEEAQALKRKSRAAWGATVLSGVNAQVPGGFDYSVLGKGMLAFQNTSHSLAKELADRKIQLHTLGLAQEELLDRREGRRIAEANAATRLEIAQGSLDLQKYTALTNRDRLDAGVEKDRLAAITKVNDALAKEMSINQRFNNLRGIAKEYGGDDDIIASLSQLDGEAGVTALKTYTTSLIEPTGAKEDERQVNIWLRDQGDKYPDLASTVRGLANGERWTPANELINDFYTDGIKGKLREGWMRQVNIASDTATENSTIQSVDRLLIEGQIRSQAAEYDGWLGFGVPEKEAALAKARKKIAEKAYPWAGAPLETKMAMLDILHGGGHLDESTSGVHYREYISKLANSAGVEAYHETMAAGLIGDHYRNQQKQEYIQAHGVDQQKRVYGVIRDMYNNGDGVEPHVIINQLAIENYKAALQSSLEQGIEFTGTPQEYIEEAAQIVSAIVDETSPKIPLMLNTDYLPANSNVTQEEVLMSRGATVEEAQQLAIPMPVTFNMGLKAFLDGDGKGLQQSVYALAGEVAPIGSGAARVAGNMISSFGKTLSAIIDNPLDQIPDFMGGAGVRFLVDRTEVTDPNTGVVEVINGPIEQILAFAVDGKGKGRVKEFFNRMDAINSFTPGRDIYETGRTLHAASIQSSSVFNEALMRHAGTGLRTTIAGLEYLNDLSFKSDKFKRDWSFTPEVKKQSHPGFDLERQRASDIQALEEIQLNLSDLRTHYDGAPLDSEIETSLTVDGIKLAYALDALSEDDIKELASKPGFLTSLRNALLGLVDLEEQEPGTKTLSDIDLMDDPIISGASELGSKVGEGASKVGAGILKGSQAVGGAITEGAKSIYKDVGEGSTMIGGNIARGLESPRATAKDVILGDKLERFIKSRKEPSPKIANLIQSKAVQYGIDPVWMGAVVSAESNMDPNAVSSAGAKGLGQMMPDTFVNELGMDIKDIFDIEINLDATARYLAQLLKRFGNVEMATAAYNAGPTRVAKLGRVPQIEQTVEYLERVERIMAGP